MPKKKSAPLNKQLVGNVGLYYCCYRLSRLGWNAMPTARNARGVDIVAYNQDLTHFIGVQVKALSKRVAVPLGTSLDNVMGDFWVIVNRIEAMEPAVFILSPADVRKLAARDKGGERAYWLPRVAYEQECFREAWNRIRRE